VRESQPVWRLEPNMSGKAYVQNNKKTIKKVVFAEDKLKQLEYCHNLVSQVNPTEEQTIEYGSNQAMLIARFIQDITRNVNKHGASLHNNTFCKKG
jgi:two-component sensor histidine kinase